jgi:hypothetical protein
LRQSPPGVRRAPSEIASILASAMEFTVGQALTRWLADDIVVDGVDVHSVEEIITIEIAYTRKTDLSKKMVRIHFQ